MTAKSFGFATLLCAIVSTAYSAPTITISPGGVQSGNWVWNVSITPDLSLVPDGSGTPIAVEFGFRLTGDPLVNVSNVNPGEFDTNNPGHVIFGWETPYGSPAHPEGIEAKCASCTITNSAAGGGHNATVVNGTTNEIFAAMGSVNFTTPGAKQFLKITALGPGNGGPLSSTIDWLGAYGAGSSQGLIAQINGGSNPNYTVGTYFFSGSTTQAVPEPASAALIATIAGGFLSLRSRRRNSRVGKR